MPELPLEGLKVIELFAIGPVPFVGLQLLQMGASVTRVSPPQDRSIGIAMNEDADLLNRGKANTAINLKSAEGLDELLMLLANADVLIEGFRPGVLERLGLSPESLMKNFPDLIIGRLSGFGYAGDYAPRAGHDINYLALSGVLAAIGTKSTPVVPLNLIADFGGGAMHLLTGILAKLVQRSIRKRGGVVETSILAGTMSLTTMTHALLADGRWTLNRQENLLDGGLPFYRVYKTLDNKFVALGALEKPFFKALLQVLDLSSDFDLDSQYDASVWASMEESFAKTIAGKSRDDWAEIALTHDCCLTPVLDFEESLKHPHNLANNWISDTPFPHPGIVTHYRGTST